MEKADADYLNNNPRRLFELSCILTVPQLKLPRTEVRMPRDTDSHTKSQFDNLSVLHNS